MAKKDYYDILGVKKTDSSDIIKKSYKKLALKYHPDKASEDKKKEYEEKFKEINEAYSTLSDAEKKRKYDSGETNQSNQNQYHQSQYSSGGGFGDGNLSDLLRDLFRGGNFENQYADDEESSVGQDLHYSLTLEFIEAVFGCEKEISIKKDIRCESCSGTGAEDKHLESCTRCSGKGRLKVTQRSPFGVISQVVTCDVCQGNGQIPKHKCKHCKGEGIINSKEKIKIKIPPGIDDSQTLRIRNAGNAIQNGTNGDLLLTINVKPHKYFKRVGFDVYYELDISFSMAALGGEVTIPTLSSEEITIKISKGTESGNVLRLTGRGIPHLNSSSHRGDQFVKITVKTPKKLSNAQIKLFEELAKLDK